MTGSHLVRFDEFMNDSLYGASGFYTSGAGRAGRRGDFITAPEVGPLFGTVVARAVDAWWVDAGRPDDFRVFEIGAGPGTLARSFVAAEPACLVGDPSRYVAVEVSARQRADHPESVTSLATLPDGELTGVVIANELLDNLPFRLLVNDGGWREAWVAIDGDAVAEVLRPIEDDVPVELPSAAPHGARLPIQTRAGEFAAEIVGRLRGRLVVFDYAVARTEVLASRPWRDWLRTYKVHERGAHYLRDIGRQDITSDVCIDQIERIAGPAAAVRSQAQFLQRWGIDELVAQGRRIWEAEAARPGLSAMKMRSRISEAEALLDPDGLGAFTVLEWAS